MKLIKTALPGTFIIENFQAIDQRGSFTKTYQEKFFQENNLCTNFQESFFSISQKNVIRGMHFQLPPYDQAKLVYVVRGEIIDVVLDLRKSSATYGQAIEVILSERNNRSIYVPKGLAHGFISKIDDTITIYHVSTIYNPANDYGVRYNSFGFDWQVKEPVLSERDKNLISLREFDQQNPF